MRFQFLTTRESTSIASSSGSGSAPTKRRIARETHPLLFQESPYSSNGRRDPSASRWPLPWSPQHRRGDPAQDPHRSKGQHEGGRLFPSESLGRLMKAGDGQTIHCNRVDLLNRDYGKRKTVGREVHEIKLVTHTDSHEVV